MITLFGAGCSPPGGGDAAPVPLPWTPADLGSSLALWLDAADAATITLNGSTVSQWRDKSGNSRHANQAVAANQPAYNLTGFNGRPSIQIVRTGASGDVLVPLTNPILDTDDFTIVTALQNTAIGRGADGFGSGWSINHAASALSVVLTTGGPAQYSAVTSNSGLIQVSMLDQLSTTSVLYYSNNGGSLNSTNAPKKTLRSSTRGLEIGKANGGSAAGLVSEVVIAKSVLTTDNRQKLEGYLAWKWGLQANLLADHPYKLEAPTV